MKILKIKNTLKVLVLICLLTSEIKGQAIQQFYLYSYDHALFNPAAAGAEDKHVFGVNGRLIANRSNKEALYHTGMISYNGNISAINSGIGVFGVVDESNLGVTSKLGISYNYKIKLAPKSSLRIGLRPTITKVKSLTYYNDFSIVDKPKGKVAGDLDFGFWFDISGFYIDGALNNLFRHTYKNDSDPSTISQEVYNPYSIQSATVIAGKKVNFPGIQIDPSIALTLAEYYARLNISTNFIFGNIFVLGGTFSKPLDYDDFDGSVNTGFSIRNKVQIVGILYTRNYNKPYYINPFVSRIPWILFEGMIRVKI